MAVKPLIETKVLTEFGEVYEDPAFTVTAGHDHTFVPGYSDLRRERDLKMGAYLRGECKRSDVPTLPVRLQWTRSMRVAGNQPDNTKEVQAGNDGYREVKASDIGQPWLTAMPAGAAKIVGGAIRKGDVTLMVCDAPRAAKNAAAIALQTRRQVQDTSNTPLLRNAQGAEPYIESTPGDKPIGQ